MVIYDPSLNLLIELAGSHSNLTNFTAPHFWYKFSSCVAFSLIKTKNLFKEKVVGLVLKLFTKSI